VAKVCCNFRLEPEILNGLRVRLKQAEAQATRANLPKPTLTWIVTSILREGLGIGQGPFSERGYSQTHH